MSRVERVFAIRAKKTLAKRCVRDFSCVDNFRNSWPPVLLLCRSSSPSSRIYDFTGFILSPPSATRLLLSLVRASPHLTSDRWFTREDLLLARFYERLWPATETRRCFESLLFLPRTKNHFFTRQRPWSGYLLIGEPFQLFENRSVCVWRGGNLQKLPGVDGCLIDARTSLLFRSWK